MQVMSATGAARIATLGGLPVVHDGVALIISGHSFVVAEECSGLNSLMALLFAAAVLVEIMAVPPIRRLVLLAAPVIVLAANTVRLTSVLLFAEFAGPGFAIDSLVHGGSDIILYLAGLGLMWALIDLVSERRLLAIIIGDHVMATTEPPSRCAGCDTGDTPTRLQGAGE
jgi:exosortase/archaeosortase family protein